MAVIHFLVWVTMMNFKKRDTASTAFDTTFIHQIFVPPLPSRFPVPVPDPFPFVRTFPVRYRRQ
jgi:hypothetical protein